MRLVFTTVCILIAFGIIFFQSSNIPMLFLAGWILLLGFSPVIALAATFFIGVILGMMMLV